MHHPCMSFMLSAPPMPLTPSIQTDHVGGAYIVKLAQLGDVDRGNVSVSAEVLPDDDALSDAFAFGFDSTEEYTAARGLIDLECLPDNGPIEPQESLPDVSDADNDFDLFGFTSSKDLAVSEQAIDQGFDSMQLLLPHNTIKDFPLAVSNA